MNQVNEITMLQRHPSMKYQIQSYYARPDSNLVLSNRESVRTTNISMTGLTRITKKLTNNSMENMILSSIHTSPSKSLLKQQSSVSSESSGSYKSDTSLCKSDPIYIANQILNIISKLENTKHRRLCLHEFMDMVRDLVYSDVSLMLFDDYEKNVKCLSKEHYLHYYIYFLNYASYYHLMRLKSNIPNTKRRQYHKIHFKIIKDQLKYIQHIIRESKTNYAK